MSAAADSRGSRRRSSALLTPREVTKSGFLLKKGEINRAWRVRWFVLQNNTLLYYKNPEAERASGAIDLSSAVVRNARQNTGGKEHALEIVTRTRVYQLVGKSREDTRDWIRALSAHTVLHTENEALDEAEEMIAKASRDTYFALYDSPEDEFAAMDLARKSQQGSATIPKDAKKGESQGDV